VRFGVGDAILIEGDLDPGIDRDIGALVVRKRSDDAKRLAGLEGPRIEWRAGGIGQGETVDRAGQERGGGREERGLVAGFGRDREGEARLDGQSGRKDRGGCPVGACQPEARIERDDGSGRTPSGEDGRRC